MFFLTRAGKVSFGCEEIAKNQERKASLTFKRLLPPNRNGVTSFLLDLRFNAAVKWTFAVVLSGRTRRK